MCNPGKKPKRGFKTPETEMRFYLLIWQCYIGMFYTITCSLLNNIQRCRAGAYISLKTKVGKVDQKVLDSHLQKNTDNHNVSLSLHFIIMHYVLLVNYIQPERNPQQFVGMMISTV